MREKLVQALAMGWRYAESHYQDYDDPIMKKAMYDITQACGLTSEEQLLLEDIGNSMGV